MRPILVAIVVGLSYVQSGSVPPEQYPGQTTHAHPPDGTICRHTPRPGDLPCSCKRMTAPDDPLCENEPDVLGCSVYCWAKQHFVPSPNGPHRDPITGARGTMHRSHCQCPIMKTDEAGKEVLCGRHISHPHHTKSAREP